MTKMIANKQMYYAGVTVEANHEFEAEEKDVHVLTVAQAARLQESESDKTLRLSRRYNRRDMQAESNQ